MQAGPPRCDLFARHEPGSYVKPLTVNVAPGVDQYWTPYKTRGLRRVPRVENSSSCSPCRSTFPGFASAAYRVSVPLRYGSSRWGSKGWNASVNASRSGVFTSVSLACWRSRANPSIRACDRCFPSAKGNAVAACHERYALRLGIVRPAAGRFLAQDIRPVRWLAMSKPSACV